MSSELTLYRVSGGIARGVKVTSIPQRVPLHREFIYRSGKRIHASAVTLADLCAVETCIPSDFDAKLLRPEVVKELVEKAVSEVTTRFVDKVVENTLRRVLP